MNTLHIKTGDNVQIMSGKDKGKQGKVLEVSPKEKKVIVEGRNLVTKHVKPRRQVCKSSLNPRLGFWMKPPHNYMVVCLTFFYRLPANHGRQWRNDALMS